MEVIFKGKCTVLSVLTFLLSPATPSPLQVPVASRSELLKVAWGPSLSFKRRCGRALWPLCCLFLWAGSIIFVHALAAAGAWVMQPQPLLVRPPDSEKNAAWFWVIGSWADVPRLYNLVLYS